MDWVLGTLVMVLLGCCTALFVLLHKKHASFERAKQLLSQSQQALEKSEHASDAKSRYLSGLSHELRTPLNVIMGHAQLLEQKEPNNPAYQLIKHNGEHLNHLIESLLSHAAMEAGKIKLHQELFDLHEVLKQIGHMFQPMAEKKGLVWTHEYSEQLPQWVKADPQRLKQILINLLSNAIKFTTTGHVTFRINYRSQVASFEVTDSGSGIKEQNQGDIFTPFERLNNTAPGTGLGLPIAQSLSTLMGGELSVKSQWQKGSTFTLKLMLAPQPAPPNRLQVNNQQPSLSLLVVDDNPSHLEITSAFLAQDKHQVFAFTSATKALEHMSSHQVDLCLLDINMPEMSGWDLATALRTAGKQIPIIMLSGNPKDQIKSEHQNHQGYLSKPLKQSALRECIAQFTTTPHIQLNLSQQATLNRLLEIKHFKGMEKQLQQWLAKQTIKQNSYNALMPFIEKKNTQQLLSMINNANE